MKMEEGVAEEDTPISTRLAAIEDRLSCAPRLAAVARSDFEWLIATVRTLHEGLVDSYWMIHGSEPGRELMVVERRIREAIEGA